MNYFDPKVLAGVKNLLLRARHVVDGVMVGIHASRAKGLSSEFEEHRGYATGDDTRHIDWKAYAKFDRYFIKEYRETTNLRAYIVMDCSSSMDYASDGVSKFDYASTLAASLAYLMLKQLDAVGVITFSDKIDKMIPPKSAHDHLFAILNALEATHPQGATSAAAVLQDLAASLKKRGLIILISDLLDELQGVTKGLRQLRSRGSEIIVFHLLDRDELQFPFKEPSVFQDMEEELKLFADPQAIRPAYLQTLESLINEYRHTCASHRIDYSLFDTSVGLDRTLVRYLNWRKKFRGR
ncbi:MAG: DUF58 domain-containing protein [Desulfobacterales bacterium]|nr:MAG: DUF58 domain-containing protein [Desulfobacterales bacterium]